MKRSIESMISRTSKGRGERFFLELPGLASGAQYDTVLSRGGLNTPKIS